MVGDSPAVLFALVRVTVAVVKHRGQNNWGIEGFPCLKFSHLRPSLKEVGTGTQAVLEPGDRK